MSVIRVLLSVAGILAGLGTTTASATLVTIDFDSLTHGDVVTTQFPSVTFSLVGSPPIAGPEAYALKDGSIANTGNPVPAFFGAEGLAISPSDSLTGINGPFFDMQLSFAAPIDFFSILALDAEEAVALQALLNGTLVASIGQGTLLGFHSASVFNGPVYDLTLGAVDGPLLFDTVVIDLTDTATGGPELYDNLRYNTVASAVPEPSTVALFAVGLFGLAVSRRRVQSRGQRS